MNLRLLSLTVLAAVPLLVCAQEIKLVNCRPLETTGYFVGPDELLDGDRVCQKAKPKTPDLEAKPEQSKGLLEPDSSGTEPMSVAEVARANRKKAATARDAAPDQPPTAPASDAPAPAPSVEPATTVPGPVRPNEPPPVPVPASPPSPSQKPEMVLPVKPPPSEVAAAPVAPVSPATPQPVPPMASASAAPVARFERDAPVAPGTPSAPPEIDHGFSDANAVETAVTVAPAATAPTTRGPGGSSSDRAVQMGAFDKPRVQGADAAPETHQTNFLPGDTEGVQEGQLAECTKNITLGSLRGERLVLGTPGWAEKWIEKNRKGLAKICFSDTPMRGAKNYLIVFYTTPEKGGGADNTNASLPVRQETAAGGVGVFTTKHGSTWYYAVDQNVGVTVLTHDDADGAQAQPGQVWYATAYTEEGVPVAERWPEKAKNAARDAQEHVSEELLSEVVEDLHKR